MTSKHRRIINICLIILAISMAIMAINEVINIFNNGWGSFNMVSIAPFSGIAVVMIVILASSKKMSNKDK